MMSDIKTQTLEALTDISIFLSKYGVHNWSKTFSHHHKVLSRQYNERNLEKALGIFAGTMGSFNDLIICKVNGHNVDTEEEEKVNNILGKKSNHVYNVLSQQKRSNSVSNSKSKTNKSVFRKKMKK